MYLIQKFKKIVQIENQRYKNKGGLSTLIALTLLFGIIWICRQIGESLWPSEIQNKALFILIGSVCCHTLTQILSFCLHLPGYLGLSTFYQKYKINKKSSWPWERTNWDIVLKKTIYNIVLNQLWVYPLMSFCSTTVGIRLRFTNFPSYIQVFSQVLIVYFIEDFFFYWAHRMFHSFKVLYKMHKIHHQYDKIYTFATQFFHPIDFALGNVMPSAMGFILLGNRAHCFTFFYWIFWKVMISTEGHSGYEFPWSPMRVIPLVTGSSYHDHHHSNNVGNYAGSCYFWDVMLQTSQPYFQAFLKDKKQ